MERDPHLIMCRLTTFSILPSRLFAHLVENCKPIAVKSKKYSKQDKEFIATEVNRQLSEGLIESGTSSWRVQVRVTQTNDIKREWWSIILR